MSFYSTLLRILPLTFLRSIAKVAAYFINQNPDKSMLWKTRINIGLAYPNSLQSKKNSLLEKV
jgi:KDO2-lipid IV(A) lauroyltransferase